MNSPSDQRGIVLIVVLWMVVLLSIMAGSVAYSMRTETRLAATGVELAQARALAEAGVSYAALHLWEEPGQNPAAGKWSADGSIHQWRFGPGQVSMAVEDAGGLIDLNAANRELLKGLLLAAGVAGDRLEPLLDAIEDWRDADDLRRLNGAEAEDYRAAGRTVGPKNGPFQSIEELQSVLGMNQEIYRRIAKGLTVYSGQAGVNRASAPAIVLGALPGMDPKTVAEYLRMRAETARQGLPPPPLPVTGAYLSATGGKAYHVSVEAQLDSGISASVTAVISRSDLPGQPFQLRAWREGE